MFKSFWDLDQAQKFVTARRSLAQTAKGLSSQQRSISLDLLACGVSTGIWEDATEALDRIKAYWKWFKQETEKNAGLSSLLKSYVEQEAKNAKAGNRPLKIYTAQLRSMINIWVDQGWLYERPKPNQVKELMLDLGLRHFQGKWVRD